MARFNGRLENLVTYSTVFIILFSAHMLSAYEADTHHNAHEGKRNGEYMTFPRVRSDPDVINWNSPLNALEDDYEGSEYGASESQQPNTKFLIPRVGRGGSGSLANRLYPRLGDTSQETIKRGGPGGGAGMWFGPRLGRVQKRSPNKDHE